MTTRIVSYRRVSSAKQGRSGLGLEAQQAAIESYAKSIGATIVADYAEVETGRGTDTLSKRPKLAEALRYAKKHRATLVAAKLDRLSRSVAFIATLMETGVNFRVCEFPSREPFMLHVYAAMAEEEGRRIASRISAALQAKKARGDMVGNVANLRPYSATRTEQAQQFAVRMAPTLRSMLDAKMTRRTMVEQLNATGTPAANGGQWSLMQLQRVLGRMPAAA